MWEDMIIIDMYGTRSTLQKNNKKCARSCWNFFAMASPFICLLCQKKKGHGSHMFR